MGRSCNRNEGGLPPASLLPLDTDMSRDVVGQRGRVDDAQALSWAECLRQRRHEPAHVTLQEAGRLLHGRPSQVGDPHPVAAPGQRLALSGELRGAQRRARLRLDRHDEQSGDERYCEHDGAAEKNHSPGTSPGFDPAKKFRLARTRGRSIVQRFRSTQVPVGLRLLCHIVRVVPQANNFPVRSRRADAFRRP